MSKLTGATMKCSKCNNEAVKTGIRAYVSGKYQMYRCTECGYQFKGEIIQNKQNIETRDALPSN